MSDALPRALFAYLSQPKPGQAVLNVQLSRDEQFVRIELNDAQVCNLAKDAVAIALVHQP